MIRFSYEQRGPSPACSIASSRVYFCHRIGGTGVQIKIVLTPHISQKHNVRGSHFYKPLYYHIQYTIMVLWMNSMILHTDNKRDIEAPRVTRLSKKHFTSPYSKSHNTFTYFRTLIYVQSPGAVHPMRWHIRTKCQMYSWKLWLDLARTITTWGGMASSSV